MKIAMLTTENSACGVAEYARYFKEEYENLGHEVLVLGNPKYFEVSWWGEGNKFYANNIWVALNKFAPDIFHVQYQGSLYSPHMFNLLMEELKVKNYRKVVTIHDSSRNEHQLDLFDDIIYHKDGIVFEEELLVKSHKLPFPIPEMIPMVFSFGMGRNDYKFIERVCSELGISFMSHDSRQDKWLSEDKLFSQMKLADVIVLWYNEVSGIVGASSAARTSIASHRPVITNNVSWFNDLDKTIFWVVNEFQLKGAIREILHLDYIEENSYSTTAERIIKEVYGG